MFGVKADTSPDLVTTEPEPDNIENTTETSNQLLLSNWSHDSSRVVHDDSTTSPYFITEQAHDGIAP